MLKQGEVNEVKESDSLPTDDEVQVLHEIQFETMSKKGAKNDTPTNMEVSPRKETAVGESTRRKQAP